MFVSKFGNRVSEKHQLTIFTLLKLLFILIHNVIYAEKPTPRLLRRHIRDFLRLTALQIYPFPHMAT